MKKIYMLKNVIQEYDWGSPLALPVLLGYENPEKKPQAELWMGSNSRGESVVLDGKESILLGKFINKQVEWALGPKAAKEFGMLPFLFKILGIEKPLSIQAHPTKKSAEEGFKRENKAGIPVDAPNRNYRDSNHKPEIICALSPEFWAMKGFRAIDAIIEEFALADFPMLRKPLAAFIDNATDEGLKQFFEELMSITGNRAATLADEAREYAHGKTEDHYQWVEKLYQYYPGDIGVLAPLYLNVVCLKEGQALYLQAGELHAYLSGLGVELMANSDNVLRGGLTNKHIDVPELLANLSFTSSTVEILEAESNDGHYITPTNEFKLNRIDLTEDRHINGRNPAQIMICTKGKGRLETVKGNEDEDKEKFDLVLRRGESVFIPYNAGGYLLSGKGEFFTAGIPS